jgi:hypothetical protein
VAQRGALLVEYLVVSKPVVVGQYNLACCCAKRAFPRHTRHQGGPTGRMNFVTK